MYDGSEIHEAVITLLAIARNGARAVCCADKTEARCHQPSNREAMPSSAMCWWKQRVLPRRHPALAQRAETLDTLMVLAASAQQKY